MLLTSTRDIKRVIGTIAILLICVVAVASLQWLKFNEIRRESRSPSPETLNQQVEVERLRLDLMKQVPTFGFDNLVSDWVFLNFLQYFGDKPARESTDYRLSPNFFDVILKHDPYFLEAYTFLSTSTALYAGMPERSIALMDQGLKSLSPTTPPGSYFVWRNKAIDELLFLGDAQAARRSFEIAADWATQSRLPGSENAADFSRQTAQFLASNPDSKTAQVAAWTMVLSNAPDDETRKRAIDRIRSLGGNIIQNPDGTFQVQPPAQD